MKSLLITLTAVLAISAVVPANAKPIGHSGKMCFVATDASRLTGYYEACTDTKPLITITNTLKKTPFGPESKTADSPRDSGGGDSGGGGGGGK